MWRRRKSEILTDVLYDCGWGSTGPLGSRWSPSPPASSPLRHPGGDITWLLFGEPLNRGIQRLPTEGRGTNLSLLQECYYFGGSPQQRDPPSPHWGEGHDAIIWRIHQWRNLLPPPPLRGGARTSHYSRNATIWGRRDPLSLHWGRGTNFSKVTCSYF